MALRITKADGTVVIVGAAKDSVPAKRATKGNRSRKVYNMRQADARVGGTTNITRAIYHGLDNGTTNYAALCRTVDPRTRSFTLSPSNPGTDLGGRGA
jgi:hypothetical protein